jgi:flagellar motility protein MotE (MotC chaperone)
VLKEEYKDNGVIRKRLGDVLLKLGRYREGLKELEYAMELLPWDSEILKILSKSYFRLGDFERASEFGEIYILRESEEKEMIKHLKEVYEKIKESGSGRMKEIAEEKIKKYNEILSKIEELNANIDKKIEGFKDNNINQMAKLYANMSPKNAAQRLAQLDDETSAKIIMKMSQKNASEILSNMEPAKAASITKVLTQIEKKIPTK